MADKSSGFAGGLVVHSMTETEALGARIAAGLVPGDAVALHGDLGAGKTTLARAILCALGVHDAVPSPTFTLVQQYETPRLRIHHFDLYRIEDPSEMNELGLDDALAEGAAFIEWPERAIGRLPADALHIHLEIAGENTRRVEIRGPMRWEPLLADRKIDDVR